MNILRKLKLTFSMNRLFFLSLIILNVIIYTYYFSKGTIVLGGEGNYWVNFEVYLQNFGYTWLNYTTGIVATTLNSVFSLPLILSFVKDERIKSFMIVSSTYSLPFILMYFLLLSIDKTKKLYAILVSLFLIINPFSVFFLEGLNPWVTHVLFLYPLYLLIILRYFKNNLKLFSIFGFSSVFFAYALANPPNMILLILIVPFFVFISQIILESKVDLLTWLKKTLILGVSFLLFNIWWIAQWIVILPEAKKMYPLAAAKSWLTTVSTHTTFIFGDIFSFLWLTPKSPDYNFLSFLYTHILIKPLLFIPFLIIIYWMTEKRASERSKKVIYAILLLLILIIFFLKGVNPPFQEILFYCFDNVPLCSVFKTAPEKFGVPFVFLSALALFYVLKDLKNTKVKYLFIFYIVVLLIPFIGGQFIPDNRVSHNIYTTRKFLDYQEFKEFRKEMENKKLDFRLLSLPSYRNYAVMIYLYANRYYLGLDPLMLNIPQSSIADYTSDQSINLFLFLDSPNHKKLSSIHSLRYIYLNKRFYPLFGSLTNKPLSALESQLDKKYPLLRVYGKIKLYVEPDFLPHFYIPKKIAFSGTSKEKLSQAINNVDLIIPSAIFLNSDESHIDSYLLSENSLKERPMLEFKKINATKYRVIIHNVKNNIPLIFSETFNTKWKAYLKKSSNKEYKHPADTDLDSNYQILKGNEEDQANKNELEKFITLGWVTLPNRLRKYDFVSKNFNGTIQNNNLENGGVFETITPGKFNKNVIEISAKNHFFVNGYSNGWILEPMKLCAKNNFCLKNADGTYDMELVIEFWPQRVFYISIIISLFTLAMSLLFLIRVYY